MKMTLEKMIDMSSSICNTQLKSTHDDVSTQIAMTSYHLRRNISYTLYHLIYHVYIYVNILKSVIEFCSNILYQPMNHGSSCFMLEHKQITLFNSLYWGTK